MIEQAHEETLSVIKEIETNPAVTQRAVSKKLGISLGKTNYGKDCSDKSAAVTNIHHSGSALFSYCAIS